MDILFSARWRRPRATSCRPVEQVGPAGHGRLLSALAIIVIVIGTLDHAARQDRADPSFALSYGPGQQEAAR